MSCRLPLHHLLPLEISSYFVIDLPTLNERLSIMDLILDLRCIFIIRFLSTTNASTTAAMTPIHLKGENQARFDRIAS